MLDKKLISGLVLAAATSHTLSTSVRDQFFSDQSYAATLTCTASNLQALPWCQLTSMSFLQIQEPQTGNEKARTRQGSVLVGPEGIEPSSSGS